MPNIITHKIFAEEVLKKLKKKDIAEFIIRHQQIYYIGCNGPDFLFFYHAKPWEILKKHDMNEIGSKLHKQGINTFYEEAIQSICREKNVHVKERMLAYLFGHLCHWALDSIAHPYIFYRTGNGKGKSASYHHRMESMLDAMMLSKYHATTIKEYPYYEICSYNEEILKAIARIYVPAVKKALKEDIKVYDIRKALDDWKDIQKMLYDPLGIKMKLLTGIEKVIHKPWLISGNIIPVSLDVRYDICNFTKKVWCHPCDNTELSHETFFHLFNKAIDVAEQVIEKAYGCIEYQADLSLLLNLLDNRAYDTGRNVRTEMKYFHIIYEEEGNENF